MAAWPPTDLSDSCLGRSLSRYRRVNSWCEQLNSYWYLYSMYGSIVCTSVVTVVLRSEGRGVDIGLPSFTGFTMTIVYGGRVFSISARAASRRFEEAVSPLIKALMRSQPGPESAFFEAHMGTKGKLERNTRAHWALHWYSMTRGRSLIPRHDENVQVRLTIARHTGLRARIWQITEISTIWNLCIFTTILVSATADIVETEVTVSSTSADSIDPFAILELVCVIIFTFELLLRTVCCPSLVRFSQSIMNWFDLLAILPWYTALILASRDEKDFHDFWTPDLTDTSSSITEVSTTLRLLRLGRVLRVFKFARYSTSVRMFSAAISQSLNSVTVLILVTLVMVVRSPRALACAR